MIHKIQITIMILILPLGGLYWYMEKNDIPFTKDIFYPGTPILTIGEIPMQVEIADTSSTRERGLSGRKDLGSTKGLLLVFDSADYHGIWMKDMLFPIDLIWISEDLKVIAIEKNLTPASYPKTFRPPSPAKYVVETNPKYADTFGITVGKPVSLPINLR